MLRRVSIKMSQLISYGNIPYLDILREKILIMMGTCKLILKVCVIKKRGKSYYLMTN